MYRVNARGAKQDCLFLSSAVLLSLIFYVQGLGFYSDDWVFLATFSNSEDQSLRGLFRTLYEAQPWARMRPLQLLYLAGQYRIFGIHPLGYHVVNSAMFLAVILLFYLTLRELGRSRLLTLTLPLVYALIPHYATDRLWFAASQVNLSMALYFLNFYSLLRGLRSRQPHLWAWALLGVVSLLGSALAYEIALPLFLLNMAVVWYRAQGHDGLGREGRSGTWAKRLALPASSLLALGLAVGFKVLAVDRPDTEVQTSRLYHAARITARAVLANYIEHGLALPYVTLRAALYYPDKVTIAACIILGLSIFWYLRRIADQPESQLNNSSIWLRLLTLGIVVFGLGYAVFIVSARTAFHGTNNRVAMAAALGVAMSFVGVTGWLSTLIPSGRSRGKFFCLLIALVCSSGFLIINSVASFWVTAHHRQQEILVGIRKQFPVVPAGTALLLDGGCPYVGPAAVFDNQWDFGGALQASYRDPTLRGDVVMPNLEIGEQFLTTSQYGLINQFPYGKDLLLYHSGQGTIYRLVDAETARHYFATINPSLSNDCPRRAEGFGSTFFLN